MEHQDQSRPTGYATDKSLANYFSVSKASIWRWSNSGKLPKPRRIGENTTRWLWSEVLEHLEVEA